MPRHAMPTWLIYRFNSRKPRGGQAYMRTRPPPSSLTSHLETKARGFVPVPPSSSLHHTPSVDGRSAQKKGPRAWKTAYPAPLLHVPPSLFEMQARGIIPTLSFSSLDPTPSVDGRIAQKK